MQDSGALASSPFAEAAKLWLEQRSLYIRESTAGCYRDYLSRLEQFFTIPLSEVHIGHFMEYQAKMAKLYHPASVNHDLNILSQMLKAAGLWEQIKAHYRPLPLPELDPPKVMSETVEERFFMFASTKAEWQLAYYVADLTNNSTASGKELRLLKLEAVHIDTQVPYFHVPKNMKTPTRQRNIPLNDRGVLIMELVIRLANSRGSTLPEHYLFPFRIKRNLFDPNRPASESWLKYRWKLLVDAAMAACLHCFKEKPDCQCEHFRPLLPFRLKPHNMRHQTITKLLDSGVPIETVRQIAGHGVDSLVTRHYHHARMEVMARAMGTIDPDKKRPARISTGDQKNRGRA